MKTAFALLIHIMLISIAESAIINGPANIRDKETNRIIASLNDGVFVPDLGLKESWFDIELICFARLEDYQDLPQKHLPIWDNKGKLIGKLIDYHPESYDEIKDQWVSIWLVGKTFKDNILQETTLEYRIRRLLLDDKLQSIEAFKTSFTDWETAGHMSDYLPPDSLKHPDLKYWTIYSTTPLSWQIQAIFVFYKNNLIAIEIERDLDLSLPRVTINSRGFRHSLYFINDNSDLRKYVVGAIKYFFDFAG
ncbi:hypothetical protein GWO43_27955 [candidate division KSB1 bacterium]|nr:hypothetical protein [candidate division KSB1 bacterium]NIV69422.1 hypothetical protein [Phycisphaerae bacterium]NIR70720.1 hypothetical protein [candidate division KSB1 bacterium]NIS27777.1 hypothetical protein [candidate division KSB1 bacterium]NIT74625.1 hypothetical protein [candidate division KSB1 bacterium]